MDSEPLPSNAPPPETAPLPPPPDDVTVQWGSSDLSMLKNKIWWQNAALFSWYYAPHCIKPAFLYIATIAGAFSPIIAATLILTPSAIQLQQLAEVAAVNLATIVIVPILLVWCFAVWVARWSAYALAYDRTSGEQFLKGKLDRPQVCDLQKQAIKDVNHRRAWLGKYGTALSFYLSIWFVICMVAMMLSVYNDLASEMARAHVQMPTDYAAAKDYAAGSSMTLPTVPPVVLVISMIIAFLSGIYITVVTLVGICVSALMKDGPIKPAVMQTISYSHKHLWRLGIICTVMFVLSLVIGSPREIVQRIIPMPAASHNAYIMIGEEAWRAVTSTFLWTFVLAPVCEFMRSKNELHS